MKKLILIVCGTVLFSFPFISSVKSQDLYEKANIRKYEKANQELPATTKKEKRVVFMGNSITEGWVGTHPEFFTEQLYRPWNQRANKSANAYAFLRGCCRPQAESSSH